jgi:hypothetical protein
MEVILPAQRQAATILLGFRGMLGDFREKNG